MKTAFKLLIVCAILLMQVNANAQILKKLKNKIDNTVDKKIDKKIDETSPNRDTKDYCDDKELLKTYQIIKKGTDNTRIFYDESSISMNSNGDSYRIIFKEGNGKNTIYTVIEDGKTLYTGNNLPSSWGKKSDPRDRLSKYVVIDSTKNTIAGQKGQTITTGKIDEEQLKQGMTMSRQTEEYQAMSAEEKAEYDAFLKEAPQMIHEYNNSGIANKTYTNSDIPSISYKNATVSLIVNGKNYLAKNDRLNDYFVSEDENSIYIYGMEAETGKSFFQVNDKRHYIEIPKGDYDISTQLLVSKDGKKASMVSINGIPEDEINDVYLNNKPTNASILNADGSKNSIKINMENYVLSNDGNIISMNKNTGEVLLQGKSIGKFKNNNNLQFEINALLIAGSSPDKIGKYNVNGSINFLDGHTKAIGAMFPVVKTVNGKSLLYWFTECDNTIYLAHAEI